MADGARRPGRRALRQPAALALALTLGTALALAGCDRPPERTPEAYCAEVEGVVGFDEVLAGGDGGRVTSMLQQLRELQAVAPPEVEPSVRLVADVTQELSTTMGTTKDPDEAAQEVFARRQADVAAITQAGTQIEAYTFTTCNVMLNETTGTVPGSTIPATGAPGSAPVSASRPA